MAELNDQMSIGRVGINESDGVSYYTSSFWLYSASADILTQELAVAHFTRLSLKKFSKASDKSTSKGEDDMNRHTRMLCASFIVVAFSVSFASTQGNQLRSAGFDPLALNVKKIQVNSPYLDRIPLVKGQALLISQAPPKEVALALADQTRPERINKLEPFEARNISSSLLNFGNHVVGKKIVDSPTDGDLRLLKNTQKR